MRRLGYGGLSNTNGARDFTGKAEADTEASASQIMIRIGITLTGWVWLIMGGL